MSGIIRSEVLRAVSGFSVLAVYLIALLMPTFVLVSDGSHLDLDGLNAGAATTRLLEPLAWSGVSAAFVGAYAVTREYYYGSMERTLAAVGLSRLFVAKLASGVVVAVGMCACLFPIWTAGAALLLRQDGLSLTLTAEAWGVYAGASAGAVLGAVIGGAVGWICRNYYLAAAILLVYPLAVEFALLRTAPDVARYSPGLVLAAVSVPGYRDVLLTLGPALGVAFIWSICLVVIAWMRRCRRFG